MTTKTDADRIVRQYGRFTTLPLLFALLLSCAVSWPAPTDASEEWDRIERLIGSRDAVAVADTTGKILLQKNADRNLVPASTLKIFTALVARHYLGADHRFVTEFYRDAGGNLKVKGYGDPLLISEVLAELASELAKRVDAYGDMILDDTHFGNVVIPGVSSSLNPYDSPNGALCVNFNTVNFGRAGGRYVSAEPQTPLLPFVMDRIRKSGLRKERIVLAAENRETTLYAGHLIRYFLDKAGMESEGKILIGEVTPGDRLVYRHVSPYSLDEAIQKLMQYSNNYIANQIFISAGIADAGAPGTLEKGRVAARRYATEVLGLKGLTPKLYIDEGSGISRKNRVSANQMLKALDEFQPHRELLKREGRDLHKTGHLHGIRTRAGYIESASGGVYRYVVLLNTQGKTTNQVMNRLYESLK